MRQSIEIHAIKATGQNEEQTWLFSLILIMIKLWEPVIIIILFCDPCPSRFVWGVAKALIEEKIGSGRHYFGHETVFVLPLSFPPLLPLFHHYNQDLVIPSLVSPVFSQIVLQLSFPLSLYFISSHLFQFSSKLRGKCLFIGRAMRTKDRVTTFLKRQNIFLLSQ